VRGDFKISEFEIAALKRCGFVRQSQVLSAFPEKTDIGYREPLKT
jgi:hypothetical protein